MAGRPREAPMLDALVTRVSGLGSWGYLVLFLGVTAECAAFLGVLVPGETLVVFGGVLAASGSLDLRVLLGVVCLGAILGDSLGYALGRRLGRPWLLRYGRWVVLWASGFVLLGYGLEAGWRRVEHWTNAVSALVGGGLALLIGLVWLRRRFEPRVAD